MTFIDLSDYKVARKIRIENADNIDANYTRWIAADVNNENVYLSCGDNTNACVLVRFYSHVCENNCRISNFNSCILSSFHSFKYRYTQQNGKSYTKQMACSIAFNMYQQLHHVYCSHRGAKRKTGQLNSFNLTTME
jgi:hypothetical protein